MRKHFLIFLAISFILFGLSFLWKPLIYVEMGFVGLGLIYFLIRMIK